MSKVVILLAFCAVLCHADLPVTPAPFRCGHIPISISKCLGNPKIISSDVAAKCTKHINECDRIKCIFDKSGWMNGNAVDKARVLAYFDQFAKDHPAWTTAVEHVKTVCLAGTLPTQGYEVNCPTYDIMHCTLTGFFKNAQPSQWSTSKECTYPRQFAASCPICPENCFQAAVPYGSCNACTLLPRTP